MVDTAQLSEAMVAEHSTVLLHEAIDALVVDPDGLYVDGTFGRGGHTAELLSRLSVKGSVIAIDKDLDAIAAGAALAHLRAGAREDARKGETRQAGAFHELGLEELWCQD